MNEPAWLTEHRESKSLLQLLAPLFSGHEGLADQELDNLVHVAETAFNNHSKNTGEHVSPFDTGIVRVGTDGLEVRLLQGINFAGLKQVIAKGVRATIGNPRPQRWTPPSLMSDHQTVSDEEWQEMFRGGLQAALESQTIVFEVWGASRVLTHQLVRSRRAGFHQQSQRSTWYGDQPEVRMPETVWRAGHVVRERWRQSYFAAWDAYRKACDAGVPYEDARYILPEGTVNYIQCEYTIREFMAVYAYRGCSMFLREMVECMRLMRAALLEQAPWMEPFVKVSCETGPGCPECGGRGSYFTEWSDAASANPELDRMVRYYPDPPDGTVEIECQTCHGTGGRKCTFQGWENVELACDKPMAKENNRVFVASPRLRIGAKERPATDKEVKDWLS